MNDCGIYLERHCWWTIFNQGTVRNQVQYLHITVKWIENWIRILKGQIWVLSDGRHCSQTFYMQIHKWKKMNLGSISWWAFCTKVSSHISLRTSPKSLKRDYYKQLKRDVRDHVWQILCHMHISVYVICHQCMHTTHKM